MLCFISDNEYNIFNCVDNNNLINMTVRCYTFIIKIKISAILVIIMAIIKLILLI